jgi:hypothetical protein
LNAGDVLLPGNKIQSPGARYLLTYQTDGNLVLYDAWMTALWASNTFGKPAGRVIMQSDGNFVVYGPSDNVQWSSGTNSVGSKLVLQNDGNLVIYDAAGGAVWATNTQR